MVKWQHQARNDDLHPSLDLLFLDSLESSQKDLTLIPNESEDAQEGGELCYQIKQTIKTHKVFILVRSNS